MRWDQITPGIVVSTCAAMLAAIPNLLMDHTWSTSDTISILTTGFAVLAAFLKEPPPKRNLLPTNGMD